MVVEAFNLHPCVEFAFLSNSKNEEKKHKTPFPEEKSEKLYDFVWHLHYSTPPGACQEFCALNKNRQTLQGLAVIFSIVYLKHLLVLRLFLFLLGALFAAAKQGINAHNGGVQQGEENEEGDNAAGSLKGKGAHAREEQKESENGSEIVQKQAGAVGKRQLQQVQGANHGKGEKIYEEKTGEGHRRHRKTPLGDGKGNEKNKGQNHAKGSGAQQKPRDNLFCRRIFHQYNRSLRPCEGVLSFLEWGGFAKRKPQAFTADI